MRTKTLEEWLIGIRLSHIKHNRSAAHATKMHRALGVPVVIVTAVVGTTVFSTLGRSPHVALVILTGVLSLSAAILSSLQTFLSYSAGAERHKVIAVKYGMLRRELEEFLDTPGDGTTLRSFSESFRAKWNQIDQEAPPTPEHIHAAALAQLRQAQEQDRIRSAMVSGPTSAQSAA